MVLLFELAIALGILVLIVTFINEYKKYREYINSDYFHMTHIPYRTMLSDLGKRGEYETYRCLRPLDGYKKFLFNCYIPKTDGTTTEIDVILIHESGIYVVESKNYGGWIFGTETQTQWTQTFSTQKGKTKKEHFFNPVSQNKVHLKWLQACLKEFGNLQFYSYIVFSKRCELKNITLTSGEHHVVKRNDLLNEISRKAAMSAMKMPVSLIDEIYRKLYPFTQLDEAGKKEHIENIKKNHEYPAKAQSKAGVQDKICPRCGGKLVLRVAKKGDLSGKKFYGCSNYPKCRYIKNV